MWQGDSLPPPPGIQRQRQAIESQWTDAIEAYDDTLAAKIMRKFGIKYAEHHPCGKEVRNAFIAIKTHADFTEVLDRWYDPDVDWPPVKRRNDHGDLVAAGATL